MNPDVHADPLLPLDPNDKQSAIAKEAGMPQKSGQWSGPEAKRYHGHSLIYTSTRRRQKHFTSA